MLTTLAEWKSSQQSEKELGDKKRQKRNVYAMIHCFTGEILDQYIASQMHICNTAKAEI